MFSRWLAVGRQGQSVFDGWLVSSVCGCRGPFEISRCYSRDWSAGSGSLGGWWKVFGWLVDGWQGKSFVGGLK